MLQMCEASLTSHHRTSAGSVNGHNKSMVVTSSSSQAIQCASVHFIPILNLSDRSFQTLSTCSSVEQNWSPVGSDSISIKSTWLHWKSAHLPLEPFETYLEAFRYGMPPHGGFAIGLERLLMQLTGAPNVRLTTLFPRDLTRLTP